VTYINYQQTVSKPAYSKLQVYDNINCVSRGRFRTIAIYAAAWDPNVLRAPKTLVEFQILCQNIL